MGFRSQAGKVGYKIQAAKGTWLAPDTWMYLLSGGLGIQRELLEPDPEIGGGRARRDMRNGSAFFQGEYGFLFRPNEIGTLIYAATGGTVTTTQPNITNNPTVKKHVFSLANVLPWLSVEQSVGGATAGTAFDVFKYTDAKINSLAFDIEANNYFRGSCGMVALDEDDGATPTAATYETTPTLVSNECVLEWGPSGGSVTALPSSNFGFEMNHNIDTNDVRLGSLFLGSLDEGGRIVTAKTKVRPENKNLYREACYGSSSDTTPSGKMYYGKLVYTATSADVITAGQPEKYYLKITIPKAVIGPFPVNFSGDDPIEHDLEIHALAGTAAEVEIELQNTVAAFPKA